MSNEYSPPRSVNCIHFKCGGCRAVNATLWFGLQRCIYIKDSRASACNLQMMEPRPPGPPPPPEPPPARVVWESSL